MGWNGGAGVQRLGWRPGPGLRARVSYTCDRILSGGGGNGFGLHGIAHALSSEPWSLVRGATAINSPLGLTSTSFVAMVALFDGVNLAAFSASSP